MQALANIAHWLGRKFILSTLAIVTIEVVFVRSGQPHLFGELCLFVGGIVTAFCGSNVVAGIKGLPGKSAQDAKDGGKPEE
jgi:hypothetical protein